MKREPIEDRLAGGLPSEALLPQPGCRLVLAEKYLRPGESTAHQVFERIAHALARNPIQAEQFQSAMQSGLLPAGRIAAAAGTNLNATLVNCFVQPIGDALSGFHRGLPGIMPALGQAATSLQQGGGVGYDFSAIRPQGARITNSEVRSAGPVAILRVFDAMCGSIASQGGRRGAQMGVLRCDHPDIESFIQAKRVPGTLSRFTLSVAVSDELMRAVISDAMFDLVHHAAPGNAPSTARQRADGQWIWRTMRARTLWDSMARAAHAVGEPGVLFIDTINRLDNLSYSETIAATNPCGEQPLPPWGACALGSVDLGRLVDNPFTSRADVNWSALRRLVRTGVEMLDRVIDVTRWPLPEQAAVARQTRRIGLGFLGLADALTMLGQRYDSAAARATAHRMTRFMCHTAYERSAELAQTLGSFPAFDAVRYLTPPRFASTLPEALKAQIAQTGLRNSHLMSIAPTASIALAFADNASSGIEPAFAADFTRMRAHRDRAPESIRLSNRAVRLWRAMPGRRRYPELPAAFMGAAAVSPEAQLAMVQAVAPWIDASISKTIHLPERATVSDTGALLMQAWNTGLKGLSVFRSSAARAAVLLALQTSPGGPGCTGSGPPGGV
jgi:ribonucleoside-diphosphate reductase alpha chain